MSLAAVPTDILILLISTNLKNRTADLLALSHTCKRFHALLLKHRSWQSDQKYFFEHTYCEIFRQGSVSQLEWFCKWYRFPRLSEGHFFLKDCLICAAKGGHLEILKVAHAEGCTWYKEISYYAAANRHLPILDWARTEGAHVLREEVTAGFAFGGHLDLIKQYKDTYGVDDRVVKAASEGGQMHVLQWAKKKKIPFTTLGVEAARSGHLAALQFIVEQHNNELWEQGAYVAAENGHKEILDWLHQKGSRIDEELLCQRALRNGHIAFVKYALEKGIISPNASICNGAAEMGDLDLLKWAISIGCQCTYIAACEAAKKNHRHIIEFVIEKKVPHKEVNKRQLCRYAAFGGHLELLRWAREQLGCECDASVADWAVRGGHIDVLQYLLDCGIRPRYGPSSAVEVNSTRTVRWLHEHGVSFDQHIAYLNEAARNGNLPMVKLLLQIPNAGTGDVCLSAATSGQLHVLKYIVSEQKAKLLSGHVLAAKKAKNYEIVQWAADHISG